MAMDELDLLGVGFIKGGVINDPEAIMEDNVLRLIPERRWVWLNALEQAGERIMGRALGTLRLDPRRFSTGEHERGGNQEVDLVKVSDFGLVHARTITQNPSTAKLQLLTVSSRLTT